MNNLRTSYYIAAVIAALLLASLACGSGTTEEPRRAASPTSAETGDLVAPTKDRATEEQPTRAAGSETWPTATPQPTEVPPTPTPEPEPIVVTKIGFGQVGRQLGFAFIVENPNSDLAFEDSRFQIAGYDEDGTVVMADSGGITLLLPGQSLGVGGVFYLDEGETVSDIEVQFNAGDPEAREGIPTFAAESIAYHPSDLYSSVTGIVSNPHGHDVTDLRVSAVVYDEAGDIIGGGRTYLGFVLANGTAGVKVSVTSAADGARVELYPITTILSSLSLNTGIPDGATDMQLVKSGFGQDGRSAGFGALIENPNIGYSVENTRYSVTAFSADGTVLQVEEGLINVVLPEQTLGLGGELYLGEGMEVDHVDVQIKAGNYLPAAPIPTFTSENATYLPGSYSSKVTGVILSQYDTVVTYLGVTAIAYDEAGEIIGGGHTFLDFAPANAKTAVEVSVTTAGAPAAVELYATLSSLSDY